MTVTGNTTYRKKLVFFTCGALVVISLAYAFGFKKTLRTSKTLAYTREQSEEIIRSEFLKKELETKLIEINDKLGNVQVIDDDQEFVLSTVHQSSNGGKIRVIEVTGTTAQSDNGIIKSTFGATVEGSFTDLVTLIRAFEESGHEGDIASATFFRYVDNKSKKTATRLKFYIQEYNAQ
jgi:hypothetical protein